MYLEKLLGRFYQQIRIIIYKVLSDNKNVVGKGKIHQPVLFKGLGKISIGDNVHFGYTPSPYFYEGSIYLEARSNESVISIGSNVLINNCFTIICDKTQVILKNNILIGTNVEIVDSDFHGVHPDKRNSNDYKCFPVFIDDNVFIGSNSKIFKGVSIGRNSIVANSSVVTRDVPENVIVGGNPAKVIKNVFES
jgi:acetyltransferase-like isoleucine patch superfamily enzyme